MSVAASHSLHGQLVLLPPNRVWRTYPGGATLDRLAGSLQPTDSHLAEDWIASTTLARNAGRDDPREGVSRVEIAGTLHDLGALVAADPDYWLGAAHVARHGLTLQPLVKFLDSGVRLHLQCHPTREFARARLGAAHGKTEAYHILAIRPDTGSPYIYAGFQRPPTREQFRHWVETQDIAALESCFDRISVQPGETWLLPGGMPHALGPGVFMIEIQEPSDLVARFEFERAGYVLPESARFMDRGIDLALDMLDFTAWPAAEVTTRFRCAPAAAAILTPGVRRETLIGPDRTDCFQVSRLRLDSAAEKSDTTFSINIVTAGSITAKVGGHAYSLKTYDKFFCPAGLGPVALHPHGPAEILECFPPA